MYTHTHTPSLLTAPDKRGLAHRAIHVRLCVYIHMCMCMHVCAYACVCIHISRRARHMAGVKTHSRTTIHLYRCIHTSTHTHTLPPSRSQYTRSHIELCMYVCVYIRMYSCGRNSSIGLYICVYVHVYVCVGMYYICICVFCLFVRLYSA